MLNYGTARRSHCRPYTPQSNVRARAAHTHTHIVCAQLKSFGCALSVAYLSRSLFLSILFCCFVRHRCRYSALSWCLCEWWATRNAFCQRGSSLQCRHCRRIRFVIVSPASLATVEDQMLLTKTFSFFDRWLSLCGKALGRLYWVSGKANESS